MAEFGAGPLVVDDILASTLSVSGDTLTEQWVAGHPLTEQLMKDGLVREPNGGNDIREPIEYQGNTSAQWANDGSIIDVSVRQIMTEMQVSWKMLWGSIAVLFSEDAKNMGDQQKIALVDSRLKNLLSQFRESLEISLFGTAPGVDEPWTLDDIVATANPSRGNFGGIDRVANTNWQGSVTDATSVGGFALAGIETVRSSEMTVSRGFTDRVGMHFTSQTLYASYQARLVQQEIFDSNKEKGDFEFPHLNFAGKPVYWSPQCPAKTWFGLNTQHLKFFINKNMRFKDYGWTQVPGGLSKSKLIGTQCQLLSKSPKRNFKITNMGV
jgi:hypothetical protein